MIGIKDEVSPPPLNCDTVNMYSCYSWSRFMELSLGTWWLFRLVKRVYIMRPIMCLLADLLYAR